MDPDQNEEANSEGLISRLYRRDTGNEIVGGAVRSGGKNVNPSKAGFNTRKGLRKKGETATAAAATSPQNLSFIRPRPKQRLTQQTMQPMSQGLLAAETSEHLNTKAVVPQIASPERTQESAVEFENPSHNPFAFIQAVKSGSADFLEFVYLRPRVMGKGERSPYNLEVTPSSAVDRDDFYTLGLSGVTHFCNGKAEFTPLERWQREFRLYGRLKDIGFFQRYRRWKSYFSWRKQVCTSKMRQASSQLSEKLFLLSPILRGALLTTRQLCQDIEHNELHKVQCDEETKMPGTTYTLDQFLEDQTEQKLEVQEGLTHFSGELVSIVSSACESELEKKFPIDGKSEDPNMTKLTLTMATGGTMGGGGGGGSKMSYTEISTKRAECRKLTNFIRLCDYLVVDTLRELAYKSTKDILRFVTPAPEELARIQGEISVHQAAAAAEAAKIERRRAIEAGEIEDDGEEEEEEEEEEEPAPAEAEEDGEEGEARRGSLAKAKEEKVEEKGPQFMPLFVSELLIDTQSSTAQLHFEPDATRFQNAVNSILNSFLDTVGCVGNLVHRPECRPFTAPQFNDRPAEPFDIGDGVDIRMLIQDDLVYEELSAAIQQQMSSGFDMCQQYIAKFDIFRKMFLENTETDARSFISEDGDLKGFISAIDRFQFQTTAIDAIDSCVSCGLLSLDVHKMKDIIAPAPTKCLSDIHALLPELAKEGNERLSQEIENRTSVLTATPHEVSDFVAYLTFLEESMNRVEGIDESYEQVRDIYTLIEENGIQVPDQQKAEFRSSKPSLDKLKQVVDDGDSKRDESIATWNNELIANIETLQADVTVIKNKAFDNILSSEKSDTKEALAFVVGLSDHLKELDEKSRTFTEYQELFQLGDAAEYEELEETMGDVSMKLKLWQGISDFDDLVTEWNSTNYAELDAIQLEADVQKYGKVAYQVQKSLPTNDAVPLLRDKVDIWKEAFPVLGDLKNEALQVWHWEEVNALLNVDLSDKIETGVTVKEMLEMGLVEHSEAVQLISVTATQEKVLNEQMDKVGAQWAEAEFIAVDYKPEYPQYKDCYILGGIDEIQVLLEDSQVNVTTVLGSRYVTRIRDKVEEWDRKLKRLADTIDEWVACQGQWMYLESIFTSPDIIQKLPVEAKMFEAIDKSWKDQMRKVKENPLAIHSGTRPGLLEMFQKNNENLDIIQKNLEQYLEEKRLGFPRFYFLGDEDLLDILSQGKNPEAVQPHINKMFDGIKKLKFGPDFEIQGITSCEGEWVELEKYFKARNEVEKWLVKVNESMTGTLYRDTKQAIKDFAEQPLDEFCADHVAMVVLTVMQICWAQDVEECLAASKAIKALKAFYENKVTELEQMADMTRLNLTKLKRTALGAVITIFVHARDVVENMIADNVNKVSDFGWAKQLRYVWDLNDTQVIGGDCFVKMTNSVFRYGYEYLGCQFRLVITPLTDRVYITVTGAIHLSLGAAPAGPAGTGKTESTKDLAKAMAYQCIVYNCSDGVTYLMIAKFFAGLVQTGAWACFDEFNRIGVEVLSVIASQVLCIRNALLAKKQMFFFEGKEMRLIASCASIITMNPGYAGRTELPDNLKVLFRSVAVMVPDYQLIAEVLLFSEGYYLAKNLSVKMKQLYKLSSEQLSAQDHYDFGMRAVKSVLVMAGGLKRENPDLTEDVCLIRAMVESNVPKFLKDDIPLFNAIVSDLFPGVTVPAQDYGELGQAINDEIKTRGLQPLPKFIEKIIQFYDVCIVRHGVALVGPTGGGKTQVRSILSTVMTDLRNAGTKNAVCQVVVEYELNPKSITMAELYGFANPVTNEWTDGIVAATARICIKDTTENHKWIIYDGPIDTLWIESMNSVLDDSKLLCLDSGERIKLNNTIHMIFEAQDLSVASPATVSRLGMIFMDPGNMGWRPLYKTYCDVPFEKGGLPDNLEDSSRELIDNLFNEHVDPALKFISRECAFTVPSQDTMLVQSLMDFFRSMLINGGEAGTGVSLKSDDCNTLINLVWSFSFIWTMGANLNNASQIKFDAYFRENLKDVPVSQECPVLEQYVDFEDMMFKPFLDLVPNFEYDPNVPYFSMLVPTVDTYRFSKVLDLSLQVNKPILFNGASGVGKSVIIDYALEKIKDARAIEPVTVQFSAQTSALRTQEMIQAKLEKKRKNIFGAPIGKRVVLFIDDMNMPKLEEFGASPPIELLRQLIGQGGFYDREKLFWMIIQDIILMGACGEPGGGRNHVTPRFLRFFHMVCVPEVSDNSMTLMFTSILGGFLNKKNFAEAVKTTTGSVVKATIDLFRSIVNDLLPTPSRCHYTFNLRDVSKVFQGLLNVRAKSCNREDSMVKLWAHEAARCFHDRLIDAKDKQYFYDKVGGLLQVQFQSNLEPQAIYVDKPLMFGNYMKGVGTPLEDRLYEEIADRKKLGKVLDDFLDDFNLNTSKPMPLVLFMDCIDHVNRIARVMMQPRGNALLVGVGGSGKQSVTQLASHVAGCICTGIELTRGYNGQSFKDDLKRMMFMAGVDGNQVTFMFTDSQIVEEGFLEDINNMLNSGEVPNLFEVEDKMKIIDGVRNYMKEHEIEETPENCYRTFILRVRDNLHMALCMSPVGEAFRQRCKMFPSLVNCCTIDWFNEWPKEALLAVATRILDELDVGGDDTLAAINQMCVDIHSGAFVEAELFWTQLRRRYYITPTSYLEFIKLYQANLDNKRGQIARQRDKLANGLRKLAETEIVVDELKEKIRILQPELVVASKEAEEILAIVAVETEKANVVRTKVSADEKVVMAQAAEANAIATDAQADLDKALPAMNAAVKALDALNKGDISEMKAYKTPPDAVVLVLNAVLLLFGYPKKKQNWDEAKTLMSDTNFLSMCKNYDKEALDDKLLKPLQVFIENEEFDPDFVKGKSGAAGSLCMWVRAMDVYAKVAKDVEPKKAALKGAKDSLSAAQSSLKEKQDALQDVENKLNELEEKQNATLAEKQRLSDENELCTSRSARAGKLTNALGSEKIRWDESVTKLNEDIKQCVGSVFLASAFLGYLGAFDSSFRDRITAQWVEQANELGIPCCEHFSLYDIMADPVEVRQWQMDGLPYDKLSVENGILVTQSSRWSLMIDPQGQARYWLGQKEKKSGLKTMRPSTPNMLRMVEGAIRNGNPLIFEDATEVIDPALEPVLLKQVYKQSGRTLLRLGDSDIDYDPLFKFYITTKLPNPHYTPELCIKVTVVNFTVTFAGLEDQLLAEVVMLERPDLEETKNELIKSMANDKKQISDLEDKILTMLKEAEGNILDNQVLVDTLEDSKKTSTIVADHLAEAEATNITIDEARTLYKPVSVRGSILYFVVADLSKINDMYQYSLDFFKGLFRLQITISEKNADVDIRCNTLIKNITECVYMNVCRGLFEKDKIVLAFLFCCSIMRNNGQITEQEWSFYVRGSGLVKEEGQSDNPDDTWITKGVWGLCDALDKNVEAFEGLCTDMDDNLFAWKAYIQDDEPQQEPLPGEWDEKLSFFQKLIFIKCVRPEKMLYIMMDFVKDKMGSQYIDPVPIDMLKIYPETSNKAACIFVFSTGCDPTDMLLTFCNKHRANGEERMHIVSLGQGQGPRAVGFIETAVKDGNWVFLQNCHLASTFMPQLELMIESWAEDKTIHKDFRIFLSTMPCGHFPITILQNGVKITTEPPRGLRANMLRSYASSVSEEFVASCAKEANFKKLIMGCVFFHGIIQERKKFGPLGWNNKYEFNDSDLQVSLEMVKMYLNESDKSSGVPWETLNYMLSEISYGGRVTDGWDRRTIKSILTVYYTEQALSDDYKYSPSGLYYAPPLGNLASYSEYISGLPYQEDPTVFGMHENANINFQLQESGYATDTIMSLQAQDGGGGGGGMSLDEIVSEFVEDMIVNLPPIMYADEDEGTGQFDLDEGTGLVDSMTTVLSHEMNRFNKLLGVIMRILMEMQKALAGLVVMSDELDKVYAAVTTNQLPPVWGKAAYPSLKPLGSWVKDLYQRIEFIRSWLHKGRPKHFWLSGFYFPQGFMTGMLQSHARKYGIAIDTLGIKYTVQKQAHTEIEEVPQDGVMVYGMYMDGARYDWETQKLEDSAPGVIYTPLPPIHMAPVANFTRNKADFECPLYKTTVRSGALSTTGHSTNFVVALDLLTDRPPGAAGQIDYWVLKGAAGVCSLND